MKQAPGGKVTQKQEALIAALLTCPSIESACKQAGLNPTTAWRWMKQPAFKMAYSEARQAVVHHAIILLQRFASTAVSTLVAIMTSASAPTSSRVLAARTVLELSLRAVELECFETRLAALEAAQEVE